MKRLLLALVLVLPLVSGCTKKQNEIVIGEYDSLTGSDATFGLSSNKGVRLALDEINAAGGVKGKKISLVTLDDQGKNEEAAAATTRLITQNKVVAIIGGVASGRSKAAAPIAQTHKVPFVSPASTNPDVTKAGDYVFRICFIDPFQGFVMAKFANETLKLKKVAILRDVKNDYSVGLADVFRDEFKKRGGEIVTDISYQAGDIDFKAQLTEIRSKNPDGIYIPGYYTEVGLIAQQARQLGIKAPLMGGDGWDSDKLSEIGKDAINGNYYSNHYTTESSDPSVTEFIKKFKAKYNETPDALAALGYDAAKILVAAMERAADLSGPAIRDELAKTKDFVGVTGKVSLNENRDAVKSAVVIQVEGKNRKYVSTVTP
ncbi:ABC transporter substrate-binding protein [Bdellovibrio reynosensis]|uniref:ABC transporter substrate-binding protein n=1 Tax=Bdellovibrio reynosensis TaxID=2835041 RepID=A0ABY4C7G8_9BACT|nr:ABC transporter substrate-binding protein [Bdellovibrio reynosensis]UOF00882.1 ABC transporter substrate-binding protein [Bdellovibrio reynosensis]